MEHGRELAEAAERIGALGIDRRADGSAVVIVPSEDGDARPLEVTHLPDGPGRPMAVIRRSRFSRAQIAQATSFIATDEAAAAIRLHGCHFSYDAAEDAVVVITSAPTKDTVRVRELLGDRVQFRFGEARRGGRNG